MRIVDMLTRMIAETYILHQPPAIRAVYRSLLEVSLYLFAVYASYLESRLTTFSLGIPVDREDRQCWRIEARS